MSIYSNILDTIRRTAAKIAAPLMAEQGFTQWWSWGKTPRPFVQDDVTNKKGTADYDLMRHDPDIKGALLIKTSGVLSKGWELTPGVDADEPKFAQAEEQCKFVQYTFDQMKGSLDDKLEDILYDSLLWGISLGEKLWGWSEDAKWIMLTNIKAKDPRLYDFKMDDYGNVTEMDVIIKGGFIPVEQSKFVQMSYNNVHDEPWGTSDLRSAYKYWLIKSKLVSWWAAYLEKFAAPTPKGTYPQNTPKSVQEALLQSLESLQQETAIIVPEGTLVEFMETAGKTSSDFSNALDYIGKQIVKAILGQTLATDQGSKSGSYAQAKVHQDTLRIYIMKLKRALEETVNEQIIRDIVDYNFADRYYPDFKLSLDADDITNLAGVIYQLITAGEVVPGETWIRPYLGLPAREVVDTTQQVDPIPPIPDSKPAPRTPKSTPRTKSTNGSKVDNAPNSKTTQEGQ